MKKILLLSSLLLLIASASKSQQNYCDFESIKVISFLSSNGMPHSGTLDSLFNNPAPDPNDSTAYCARYIRDSATTYDFLKMYPDTKLVDVTPYASTSFSAPRIRMKVYTNAPVGTMVQVQLGIKSVDNYPAGIHSEYMAATTAQNMWHTLTFNYYQSPTGSLALPTNIDKIVVLFNPGSNTRDTFYFDDPTGPNLLSIPGVPALSTPPVLKLYQNSPNPAVQNTSITFDINSSGHVSLRLFDLLGNEVAVLADQDMQPGSYSVPVETGALPEGIYFYVLKMNGLSRSMKMVVCGQ
ncbi:MAG: T9SS type A sorting domain-containing protein [Bacteroidota bacterium]